MGTIMEVLQWIIPSGAIASVITWLVNRSLHNARSAKEKHDLYKIMYENAQETTLTLQQDVQKLNIAIIQLERAVSKATLCKYYDDRCPVRHELQNSKGKYNTKPIRQPGNPKGSTNYPRSGTTEPGGDENDSGETSDASHR